MNEILELKQTNGIHKYKRSWEDVSDRQPRERRLVEIKLETITTPEVLA
jgi:hypothetical protein